MSQDSLLQLAQETVVALGQQQRTLVLAESCTAGLVAATLSRIPGISQWLCGSAVVYQEETKSAWLGISPQLFTPEGPGVVSRDVAIAMAEQVLTTTPHADLAVSITGHLGPAAPAELDGVVWIGTARRGAAGNAIRKVLPDRIDPAIKLSLREQRQLLAARHVLEEVRDLLNQAPAGN